jgi:hypothetical protein
MCCSDVVKTVDVVRDVSIEGCEKTACGWTLIGITYVENPGIVAHIK